MLKRSYRYVKLNPPETSHIHPFRILRSKAVRRVYTKHSISFMILSCEKCDLIAISDLKLIITTLPSVFKRDVLAFKLPEITKSLSSRSLETSTINFLQKNIFYSRCKTLSKATHTVKKQNDPIMSHAKICTKICKSSLRRQGHQN